MPFKASDTILVVAPSQEIANEESSPFQIKNIQVILTSELEKSLNTTFDGILSINSSGHNSQQLTQLVKHLKPGSTLVIRDPLQSQEKDVFMALTIAGAVDVQKKSHEKFLEFVCVKPDWQIGSAQVLNRKKKASPAQNEQQQKPVASKVWTLGSDDITEGDLEDENKLLEQEDLIIPKKKLPDDCETGPRKKACKNCSCGRAEEELKSKPKEETSLPKSSCGSCYLGDAFRCATCPHLGKPAFKPGSELKLDLDVIDT